MKFYLLFLLVFSRELLAQDSTEFVKVINLNSQTNGTLLNVTRIRFDQYNLCWLTTQDGVFRFDSKTFKKTDIRNTAGQKESWTAIQNMYFDSADSSLYAISTNNGIAILDRSGKKEVFRPVQFAPGHADLFIWSIARWQSGLCIHTNKGLYFVTKRISESGEASFQINTHQYTSPYSLLEVLGDHELITLETDFSITRFTAKEGGSQLKRTSLSAPLEILKKSKEAFSISKIDDNKIAIGTDHGLYILRLKNNEASIERSFFEGNAVYAIFTDHKEHNIYASTSSGLFKITKKGQVVAILDNSTKIFSDELKAVYSITMDPSGNLWLGTQSGPCYIQKEKNAFFEITNTTSNNQPLKHVYHISKYKNELIISCADGLYRSKNEKNLEPIQTGKTFFLSFTGPKNDLIVSDIKQSYSYNEKALTPVHYKYPELGSSNYSFNDYAKISDTAIYLSTENNQGVYQWNPITHTFKRLVDYSGTKDHIGQNNGLSILGNSLFILTDSAIYKYDPLKKNMTKYLPVHPITKKRLSVFFDLIASGDKFYIASYGSGLAILNKAFEVENVISEAEGLTNNGVYKIERLSDSLLAISTNNGLNLFNLKSGKIHPLFKENGIHGNTFEEFSSFHDRNNFYFGGLGGITVIKSDRLDYARKKPTVLFTDATLSNKNSSDEMSLLGSTSITLPSSTVQAKINFQNIIYPSNITKYLYKISSLNQNWIDNKDQNFITLIGLSPGTYHLQVQAFNEDGLGSEIKELTLVFLPKWYQTWWFKSLIVFALIAAAFGLYRIRINQIRNEARIRNQLASDLHDDLGSTLNSIKIHSNLALMEKDNPNHLLLIKQGTQDAISGIRDIIWVLDDKRDLLGDILARISQFAEPLCFAQKIQFRAVMEDDTLSTRFGKEEKRNLYMILKESINNSLKYAQCQKIEIRTSKPDKKLRIEISDDGIGFDSSIAATGYGLQNIRNRAKTVGYDASINSEPGKGTRILLEKK